MATMVVIAHRDEDTAEQARATVWELEEELIIQADQVAVISRDPEGRHHVHTSHSGFSTAGGAIWGGFWGLLFGALFLIPFAGWAMGAGLGALFGHLRDKGIDQAFQQRCATPSSRGRRRCSWSSSMRRRTRRSPRSNGTAGP
jgi:uncharacterized membrane protein